MCVLMGTVMTPVMTVSAEEEETAVLTDGTIEADTVEEASEDGVIGDKAMAAAIAQPFAPNSLVETVSIGILRTSANIWTQTDELTAPPAMRTVSGGLRKARSFSMCHRWENATPSYMARSICAFE